MEDTPEIEINQNLEDTRDLLESILINVSGNPQEAKIYMGGFIDCLFESGKIDDDERNILQLEYSN